MHRVRLLRHHGIKPYLVFDGGPLPAKQGTEAERRQRREENLSRANALAAQGKQSQAREYYVKCIDVTPQMAYQLIKVRTTVRPSPGRFASPFRARRSRMLFCLNRLCSMTGSARRGRA